MSFNQSFLEDEVRLGFYIPSSIKQAWAAELEVLDAIDRVCTECNIKYFADWGTLLGAIRHGGFIPWDDDLDLVMLREDYDLFLKKAPSLLPQGYTIHTFRNEEGFKEFHAVVINTEHARFDEEHFKTFHGFPYMCGIDIFVLDYVYPNEEDENRRVDETLFLISLADGILAKRFTPETVKAGLAKAELICKTSFTDIKDSKKLWIKLYEEAEKKCAEVTSSQSDILTQMVPWGLKKQTVRRYNVSDYSSFVRVPFEYTTIPVPLFYDKLLSKRYGNYMSIVKNAGAHDYPYFEKQKKDLEALLDFEIPHFKFSPDSYNQNTEMQKETWRDIMTQCLGEIDSLIALIQKNAYDIESICNAQQLAIDLGNFIEELKGEGHISVKSIEILCESLYSLFTAVENKDENLSSYISSINSAFGNMKDIITQQLLETKEVVFLPFKAEYWSSFEPEYNRLSGDPSYNCTVVPIPYFYKNFDGTLSDIQYNLSSYPEKLNVMDYNTYSFEFKHPDIIYIQYPYDEFDPVTGILPCHYSSYLKQYTDKLVFIPYFETDDFTKESDIRSYKNLTHYLLMPGFLNSDSVILSSESLKQTYIGKLVEWSEKDYSFFDPKFTVIPKTVQQNTNDKKTILYYISEGVPFQNPDRFIDKLVENMKVFCSFKSSVNLIIGIDKNLMSTLSSINPLLASELEKLLDSVNDETTIKFIEGSDYNDLYNICDAYYGDVSPMVCEFTHRGKPVMIQDYTL